MSGEAKVAEPGVQAPQCQFFVQRKKRLCRMTVRPGRQFCGEHEPQPKGEAAEVDRRIPCPNDSKHTCYSSKLEKHLKICNARRTAQPAYMVDNINAPAPVETCPRKPLSTIPKDVILKLIDKVNHLYSRLNTPQYHPLSLSRRDPIYTKQFHNLQHEVWIEYATIPPAVIISERSYIQSSFTTYNMKYEYLEGHIKAEPPQPIHRAVLPDFSAPDRAESSLRHLRQTSALLWLVESEGLVRDGTCYVELGAGKGQLSYYACHAWCARAGRVLAIDRAPLRHKRDNKLRSAPPRSNRSLANEHLDVRGQQVVEKATDTEIKNFKENKSEINAKIDFIISEPTIDPKRFKRDVELSTNVSNLEDGNMADDRTEYSNSSLMQEDKMKVEVNSNEDTTKIINIANSNGVTDTFNNDVVDAVDEVTIAKSKSNRRLNVISNAKEKSSDDPMVDAKLESGDRFETESGNNDNGASKLSETGERDREVEIGEDEVSSRVRADLAHLALEAVPAVAASAAVVGIAKHLCGVATDYALRCAAARGAVAKTRGVVLATCCHHRCERAAYVGGSQLQELGIDAEEFNIMLGIVSWATCGDGRSRERRATHPDATNPSDNRSDNPSTNPSDYPSTNPSDYPSTNPSDYPSTNPSDYPSTNPSDYPSRGDREVVGRRAKAVLDYGRVLWLRERGFDARLCYYVPREVSLENVCIVARKR